MTRLKKFLAVLTLFLFSSSFAWADAMTIEQLAKSNEELRKIVTNLTGKVEDLEGRLARTERAPQTVSVGVPAPEGTGGVLRTAGGDIHLDGFVDTSFNWNFATPNVAPGGSLSTANTTLRSFDREGDTFDLNSVQLNIYRPAPEAGGVGFRTEFTYGTDAQVIESTGFSGGTDEFSIQEAFVEIKAPIGSGLTVWVGKFATLLGAEVIENYMNWNSSRSLLFNNAIPFTHTGARAMYNWMDGKVVTTVGLVNGWDLAIDNNKDKDIEAQIKWIPNENFNIAQNFMVGSQVIDDRGDKRYIFDTVATWVPLPEDLPKLTLMANYDYGTQERGSKTGGALDVESGPSDWQGYALYAKYDYNDWLTFGARWEQFWDDQAIRTGTATLNELWEMTYTADLRVYKNLLTRLEYRHDHGNSNGAQRGPFDNATSKSQDTVGASLIYLFG